ncbi:hypothetical protein DWX80_04580 [Ruminococcus sp. AF21-3]|nr:hypothetical protein DWX80_04580 [Ruminococcus sp. AF21-3]
MRKEMKYHSLKKTGILTVLATVCFSLPGCGGTEKKSEISETVSDLHDDSAEKEINSLAEASDELTVWSAYWDCEDDIDTLKTEADNFDQISLFAAYFKDGTVTIPDATDRMLRKIRRREETQNKKVFLSVVNDVEKNGKTVQKDTEILKDLLGTEEKAEEHAKELTELAAENGYDGIEIDYEKIRSDMDLWNDFIRFENLLITEADKKDLDVRIILEPSTPVEELDFPQGASYAVMCYNLYGNGTDPGPKADLDFIKEMYTKFKNLPDISFALSNGGYDWENGTQKATQKKRAEIDQLIQQNKAEPQRDTDSGALSFEYEENHTKHIIWYADEETLKQWTEELNSASGGKVKVSLWRI